jgi:hypothetical protein
MSAPTTSATAAGVRAPSRPALTARPTPTQLGSRTANGDRTFARSAAKPRSSRPPESRLPAEDIAQQGARREHRRQAQWVTQLRDEWCEDPRATTVAGGERVAVRRSKNDWCRHRTHFPPPPMVRLDAVRCNRPLTAPIDLDAVPTKDRSSAAALSSTVEYTSTPFYVAPGRRGAPASSPTCRTTATPPAIRSAMQTP